MSRHRSKNVDYDDYDDDYDDYGVSPASYGVSPSTAGYLIDRSNQLKHSSLGAFLTPDAGRSKDNNNDDDDDDGYWELPAAGDGDEHAAGVFQLDEPARGFPSQLGVDISTRPQHTASPKPVDLSRQRGADAFRFDTESPDDAVLSRQQQAFQRKTGTAKPSVAATAPIKKQPAARAKPAAATTTPTKKPTAASSSSAAASSSSDSSELTSPVDLKRSTGSLGKIQRAKQRTTAQQRKLDELLRDGKKASSKGHINLVTIGHVDAGKSTLMGCLLLKLGYVDAKLMHKYSKESEEMGKASFALAWIMDAEGEERARGVTIDVSVNYLETDNHLVTLLDAPGHKDFVPKMLTGTAQADVALLVIDAVTGKFEAGFQSEGQTREHALLAHALGVGHLIVAVNKLDTTGWSKERFDYITGQLDPFLTGQVGFRNVQYVPISALHGVNVAEPPVAVAELAAWYTGPTLLRAVDAVPSPQRPVQKPFRLSIADTPSPAVICGRIQTGVVAAGDTLLVMPLRELVTVKHIKKNGAELDCPFAVAGDNIDLHVAGLNSQSFVSTGSFLCDPEHPIPVVSSFLAKIYTFDVPKLAVLPGDEYILHSGTNQEPVQIAQLVAKLDHQGKVERRKPRLICEKSFALVKIKILDTDRSICIEKYDDYKQLGRFLLRHNGVSIAQGITTELIERKLY